MAHEKGINLKKFVLKFYNIYNIYIFIYFNYLPTDQFIAKGLAASPGAVGAKIVFSFAKAKELKKLKKDEQVILVR